jgi:hypothetical protein
VELIFDPFDLAKIQVRYQQRPMGAAVPFRLGRHVHPAAAPDPADPVTPQPSGIDYLAMVEQRIAATQRRRIAYASLPELPAPIPDPGADAHDHAATPDPSTGDTTMIAPADVGLHPATTTTPDPAGDQAAGGPTTPPATNITAPSDTPQTMEDAS